MQRKLKPGQLEAFYHDEFVTSQITHFDKLLKGRADTNAVTIDIGGGVGHFGEALQKLLPQAQIRVLDMDEISVQMAKERGILAVHGDALSPPISGDEDVACFNLILHHLIGKSEAATLDMQSRALLAWRDQAKWLFVDEYIYDSYLLNLSGKLIYWITRSRLLSAIGRIAAKFVPSLNANTFGIGVRFRSNSEWRHIFAKLGFEVVDYVRGPEENVSLARRLLLIRSCRRDSYLLQPSKR